MIKLYPEQLLEQLNKKLYSAYLIIGSNEFMINESYNLIIQVAKDKKFNENYSFTITNHTNWEKIFLLCKNKNLFSMRQILQISLPENLYNVNINLNLEKLVNLIHNDLILIIKGTKLSKLQINTNWFNKLNNKSVLVICNTPEQNDLLSWIDQILKKNNIKIDYNARKLLCYCYEGNIPALIHTLELLKLLWPNIEITSNHLKQVVNDVAHFTVLQLVNCIFVSDIKRALHILKQLRLENIAPEILLKLIQYNVILLTKIKHQSKYLSFQCLINKYKIWHKNNYHVVERTIKRLNYYQLFQVLNTLINAEIEIRQNQEKLVWLKLENILLILCHQPLFKEDF